nr:retrovirus-related Pol polyprotein from transposon TNT 1-94 [Tanacetum cinerariifolium]
MKDKLSAHQETISILSQQKEAQIKFYKTRKDKELDKVIALENKVKVLDNIVYKTSCYNDNLALMLALEYDEVIRLEKESRSKLSDLIRPFNYKKLNNLYDLFVPQCEKSSKQRYFSERSRLSHASVNNGNSKESFNKQTTVLEKQMDESIPLDKNYQSSIEIFKVKTYVNTIINEVELCKEKIANRTYSGYIDPFIQNTIEANFSLVISRINAGLEQFYRCLNEEMVTDLRYFNSLKLQVDSLRSQLETQKTQFLNEIDRLSREYYYADHMNAILGVYTKLDEDLKAQLQDKGIVISELKKLIEKLKGKYVDTKFEKSSVIRQLNAFKSQRPSVLGVIPITSVSRLQLKSNPMGDSVLHNNSQGKKQDVEDHHRSVKFSKNKTSLVEIVLFIVDSGCSKHMMGNLKLLINFVEKFLGTNRSLVIPRHEKTSYHDRKPSVKFFHIYGSLCYIVRDGENLDKMKEKVDECIFVRDGENLDKMKEKVDECIFVSLSPVIQRQANVPQADRTVTTLNELDLLFSLMFDELLNGSSKVVSKSSAVSSADAPNQRQQHITPLNNHITPASTCGDKLVSWSSKKQDCTSMSFVEADHSHLVQPSPAFAYQAYRRQISLHQREGQKCRLRNISLWLNGSFGTSKIPFIWDSEKVEKGIVELFFVETEYQLADLFTKALPEERFKYLVRRLGMRCLTPTELEALANESS